MRKIHMFHSCRGMVAALRSYSPEVENDEIKLRLKNGVTVTISDVNHPGIRKMDVKAFYCDTLIDESSYHFVKEDAVKTAQDFCRKYAGMPSDPLQARWMAQHYAEENLKQEHNWHRGNYVSAGAGAR